MIAHRMREAQSPGCRLALLPASMEGRCQWRAMGLCEVLRYRLMQWPAGDRPQARWTLPPRGESMRMAISARALNRATLARQLLLGRQEADVPGAMRRIAAIQAQQPSSPYIALWNRVRDLAPASVDAAFADGRLIKASLMRTTLHAVNACDYPFMHMALQPSLRRWLRHPYFVRSGLSPEAAEAVLPELLAYTATPRTGREVQAWLDGRLGIDASGVWWALRRFGPFRHAATGGPWSFGPRPVYIATRTSPSPYSEPACGAALERLAVRYLAAFGPASVADLAQFALVQRGRVRAALDALGCAIEPLEGPNGTALYDVPGGMRPPAGADAPPRLMAMWDSALLAYADRRRLVPAAYREHVFHANGDVLPTVLVDGYVAGVWRLADGGVEVMAFRGLPRRAWRELAEESQALSAFLGDRLAGAYRRYDGWWAKLPVEGERRLL